MRAAFPDLYHAVETEFVNGELIAAVIYSEGTHLGPYWGVAPTGLKVRFRVMISDRIVDSKVVLHHAAPGFLGLFAQLTAHLQPVSTSAEA